MIASLCAPMICLLDTKGHFKALCLRIEFDKVSFGYLFVRPLFVAPLTQPEVSLGNPIQMTSVSKKKSTFNVQTNKTRSINKTNPGLFYSLSEDLLRSTWKWKLLGSAEHDDLFKLRLIICWFFSSYIFSIFPHTDLR